MTNPVRLSNKRFKEILSYLDANPDAIREMQGMNYADVLHAVDDILRVKEANSG
jgi:hypothetical protein